MHQPTNVTRLNPGNNNYVTAIYFQHEFSQNRYQESVLVLSTWHENKPRYLLYNAT
jgi:hypothetical protein